MRSEYYIAQIFNKSDKLRGLLCKIIDIRDFPGRPERIWYQFFDPSQITNLAYLLNCAPTDVFIELERYIADALGRIPKQKPKIPFKIDWFFKNQVFIEEIARQLKCPFDLDSILSNLFEIKDLKKLARKLEIIQNPDPMTPSDLFESMVNREGQGKLLKNFKQLTGDNAIYKILILLSKRPDLKEIIDSATAQVAEEYNPSETLDIELPAFSQLLDSLAIFKIKELLQSEVNNLLQEAEQIANMLRDITTPHSGPWMLLPLIEFYGKQAYRSALEHAISFKRPLKSFNLKEEEKLDESYTKETQFRINASGEENNQRLTISCNRGGTSDWKPFLVLNHVDKELYAAIKQQLLTENGKLLGPRENLCDRVLETAIELHPLSEESKKQFYNEILPLITQAFVLTKQQLPDPFGLRDSLKDLNVILPETPTNKKTLCPSPEDVSKREIKDYERKKIPIHKMKMANLCTNS